MPQMTFDVAPDIPERLVAESRASHRTPDAILDAALDKYLEDQEDIREAMSVIAEVEAGRLKVVPWEEVEESLKREEAYELEDCVHG